MELVGRVRLSATEALGGDRPPESLDMAAQPRFEPAEGKPVVEKIWCGGHQGEPEGGEAILRGLRHNRHEIASLRSQ